jgi:hypothetical protein
MSWLSKQLKSVEKRVIRPVAHFTEKAVKDVADFQVNVVTLGLIDPKWGSERLSKAGAALGITAAAVAGGMYASSLFTTPAVTAVGSEAIVSGATGAELEIAAGSGVSAWVEPTVIASGAGTKVSSGIFASISEGLKTAIGGAGIVAAGLFGSLKGAGQSAVDKILERETNSMFGGSGGASGAPGTSQDTSSGFSLSPILIIGLVVAGAFIFMRQKGKGI